MADSQIIKAPSIASIDTIIEEVCDAESAKDAVSWMDKLKKLLEIADEYKRYACEYCTKEACLYVRIAKMDDADSLLTKGKKALVTWIRSKSEDELAAILNECASGCRITSVYRREQQTKVSAAKSRSAISEFKRISGEIVERYKQTGKTVCSPSVFFNEWQAYETPDKETSKAYTEKTRDRLLRMGGVGIADGIGTYIDPTTENRSGISAAITVRLESIYADMCAITQICETSHFRVPRNGIDLLREKLDEMESL